MYIHNGVIRITGIALLFTVNYSACAGQNEHSINKVLAAYVERREYIQELRATRTLDNDYPELVAALTDYDIWQHGMLVNVVLEDGGEVFASGLRASSGRRWSFSRSGA